MDQRATESAKPSGSKRRRKRAAKSEVAEAPAGESTATEFEQAGMPNEPGDAGTEPLQHGETPGLDRSTASEADEVHFANVTASLVERGRHDIAPLLPDPSRAEPQKSAFLNSTAGLFVYKGKAKPSVIEAPLAAGADEKETEEGEQRVELAETKPDVDGELHRLRSELSALQATLADRESALEKAASDLEQARARSEQEKTAEAERVAQIEAQWQQKLAGALSEARAESDSAHDEAQKELARLQAEAATLHSTLQQRERALEGATSDHQQALKKSRHDAEAAQRTAEQNWKAAEQARIAEAEAKWQEQSASTLTEMRAKAEAARNEADAEIRTLTDQLAAVQGTIAERDKALAKAALEREQVREQAEAARNRADSEVRNLNGQLGRLRGTVADRDKALAKAASDAEQMRGESEAARNRADQEIRSLTDQLTATQTTLADREKALAKALSETKQVREQADAARARADQDIRSLNNQLATAISDGEAALAKAAMEAERLREQAQQDLQAVLAKAEAREAGEAARLAAAEARWRQQSAAALNEATARYQSAEGMLTQLRLQGDRARTDAVGGSIKPSGAPFGTRVAEREVELAPAPMPSRAELGLKTQEGKVVLRPNRIMAQQDDYAPRRRRMGRDLAVVAMLAAVVVVAYPRIEPLLPQPLRTAIRGALSSAPGGSAPSASVPSAPTQRSAQITAEVNLRAGPSRNAEVIATLPRGLKVTVFDRREDWILIRVEGAQGNGQRQGWVFGTFLQDVPEPSDAPQVRSSALSRRQ